MQSQTLDPLIVARSGLQAIQPWPLELRELFDPDADWEQAERAVAICEQNLAERERRADLITVFSVKAKSK